MEKAEVRISFAELDFVSKTKIWLPNQNQDIVKAKDQKVSTLRKILKLLLQFKLKIMNGILSENQSHQLQSIQWI